MSGALDVVRVLDLTRLFPGILARFALRPHRACQVRAERADLD